MVTNREMVQSKQFLYCYYYLSCFKGGYLDFSHPPRLKNTYIKEIFMKKEYKSSIIKNHKITNKKKKKKIDGVSLKGYVAS